HLREGRPPRPARRHGPRRTAPHGARRGSPRVLPRRGHPGAPRAGRVGRRAPSRRREPRELRRPDAAGSCPMTLASALHSSLTSAGTTSSGEAVLFWVLGPLMVLGALGLLFSRRTVHVAVS